MNIPRIVRDLLRDFRSFNQPARLFLVAIIMDGIVYSTWSLFFNFYILERGFSKEFLGLANALPSLAILLTGLPMGRLSDRIGRKVSMVIGLGVSIVFLGLEVLASSPWLILTAAFLSNVAGGLYYLSQAPFMMRVSNRDNRTLLFSLNFGLVTLAGAFGSLFAGQLPAIFSGLLGISADSATAYQAVLLLSVFLSFGTLVPLLLIKEPPPVESETKKVAQASTREVLSQPMTWQLSLPNLAIGLGASLLIPYLNVFLVERFHISDQLLGALFSLSALLTGVGSIIGPRLANVLGGKIRAVVFTQTASLLFLILMGFTPLFSLAALGLLARGTLMNMAMPLYSAFAMEQVPEHHQGTVNSVKELAWQAGFMVGPYISGIVQQDYGFSPLFVATSILYAVSTAMTWAFFHRSRELPFEALPLAEAAD